MERGRTEEEIAESLGDPVSIAKSIKAEYSITRAEREPGIRNIVRAIITVAGLGLFNLIFVLMPLSMAVWLLFVAYIMAAVFIAMPLLMLMRLESVSIFCGDTPAWMVAIDFHII